MIIKASNNKKAIIILHEIYGINSFIEEVCSEYHIMGFDVYCPEMLQRKCFSYSEVSDAYDYFTEKVGFDYYREIEHLIEKLKLSYDQVFVFGLSVGAALAWRCCENADCDGIICCYGSRIRDYLLLQPRCPVLLLFAANDSFDVDGVIQRLREKPNAEVYKLHADHGFLDLYSEHFNMEQARIAKEYISDFFIRNACV